MNAKELSLSKLNAGTKTIGMYIYGISIGMDFRDIGKILMSDIGNIIVNMLDSDVFLEIDGYSKLEYLFKYFDEGPRKILNSFNTTRDIDNNIIVSPLDFFTLIFNKTFPNYKNKEGILLSLSESLVRFGRSNLNLLDKIIIIENFRNLYRSLSTYSVELYNLLIDFIEDYIIQSHTIGLDNDTYLSIKTLSEGAEEMRLLGSILGLNLGIKSKSEEMLNLINAVERAIYNKTGNLKDLVDLNKFVFDEKYRQECIEKYENIKHSFNIYDVVSTIPHFMGYLQTLAVALKEISNSYKFKSIKNLSLNLSEILNYKKENEIIKGILDFVGDYLRKQWMLSDNITIVIPKGNRIFDKNGNISTLTEDTPIILGTDWGDATFRMFMENEIIPNLQKGIIKTNLNEPIPAIINNKFIQDLGNDLLTTTISGNPSIIYTLPINMLPRVDLERAIFNSYKAEFNKLARYKYLYLVSSYDNDGNILNSEESIPLLDLFTYYAMIANRWKLGEKSLVPILEDFLNTGIIDNFHKYVALMDKSNEYLSLELIDLDDLLPYISPKDNPYSSYINYIWHRNKTSRKYQLMRKLSREEQEYEMEEYDNFGAKDTNIVGKYKIKSIGIDTNYFLSGQIESSEKKVEYTYIDNGLTNRLYFKYDINSGKLLKMFLNGTEITIPADLSTVPFIKVNGIKKIDIQLIESIIKKEQNSCQFV